MLKTDYKDDIFTGKRKYNMVTNLDETVSFTDATTYTRVGDDFGGSDINNTNIAVNNLERRIDGMATEKFTFKVPASGWVGEGPWEQRIDVPGMTANGTPLRYLQKWNKEQLKALGNITDGETYDGYVILKAEDPEKKPAVDIDLVVEVLH